MKRNLMKLSTRMGKVFVALALLVTVSNVNSTCMFITHQPELPADSKKLRKFYIMSPLSRHK